MRLNLVRNFFVVRFGQVSCGCGVGDLDVDCATGSFCLRAPSRHVWWVDFGVMEWGVMCAATTATVGVFES